ncbi:AAA family ATPase [Euzebya sp.]|uniref:AAA family ATPase n=1 Tax=Euzebya sp. TaxID=1971409 RepID=UPI003513FDC3
MDTEDFARTYAAFLRHVIALEPAEDTPISRLIREHLEVDPRALAVIALSLPAHDHPNLQRAIDAWAASPGRDVTVLGLGIPNRRFNPMSLGELLQPVQRGLHGGAVVDVGPVDYRSCPVSLTESLSCIQHGLVLMVDGDVPLVALVHGPTEHSEDLEVELLAAEAPTAERVVAELRDLVREHDVHRGQAIVLGTRHGPYHAGSPTVEFVATEVVARDDVILPAGALEQIEQQTLGVTQRAAALRAAGQPLKRGLLLYGPPGTGKTHTLTHLMGRMPDRTTIVLSGTAFGMIAPAAEMARALAPSMLVMEDVDLVAQERDIGPQGTQPLLFELLNEMDGIGPDADVIFALTTNRADLLEPALAQRPGRIDLAVEIPLPDADGRRRLLATYGRGFDLTDADRDAVVTRTDGVTASFLRELCRRAVLHAAGPDGPVPTVGAAHVSAALDELLGNADELRRRMTGSAGGRAGFA